MYHGALFLNLEEERHAVYWSDSDVKVQTSNDYIVISIVKSVISTPSLLIYKSMVHHLSHSENNKIFLYVLFSESAKKWRAFGGPSILKFVYQICWATEGERYAKVSVSICKVFHLAPPVIRSNEIQKDYIFEFESLIDHFDTYTSN